MTNVLSDPSYFLPPLIAVAVTLALIILALLWSRRDFRTGLFCGLLMSMVIWNSLIFGMRSSPDVHHALPWARAAVIPSMAGFLFYYHFTLIYTSTRGQRRILLASYLLLVVFAALAPTDVFVEGMRIENYGYAPTMSLGSYVVFPVGLLLVLGGARNLLKYYKACPSYEERNRLTYLAIAAVFPLIGGLLDGFTNLPPMLIWGNLIFCILCSIAIMKYHLLDIRIFIRKSLVYLLISVVVAIPYVGILFFASKAFRPEVEAWWIYAVMILFLAIILRPLYGWAQNLVDRLFFRDRYDYLRALEQFSHETRSIANPEELGSTLVRLVGGALKSSSTSLLLLSEAKNGFAVVCCVGLDNPMSGTVMKPRSPLVKWLELNECILSSRDLDVIPELQNLARIERENLAKLRAELYVPIKSRKGQLSGILVLGQKLSRGSYSDEDSQLLMTLSNQMAVVIENARLYNDAIRARENLQTWLNSMSDCIIIVRIDHTIEFMNKSAIGQFGSRTGGVCWNALGKEAQCTYCPMKGHPVKNIQRPSHIVKVRDKEYEVVIAPLTNPGGSLSIIEALRDVTERKRMEEELQIAEQNFRNSLDNSPLGIRIVTSEGELLYANQAILDIYGYSSIEELKSVPAKQRYTPESYAEHQERKEKRKLGKPIPPNYEISIVCKDGEVRQLAAFRKEVFWNGQTQFQTLYQDVTERKQAEIALQWSEEFNSSLLTNCPGPILVLNADASIRYANPALEKLTGFPSAELIGRKPPFPWWIEGTREECGTNLAKAMRRGTRRYEQLFRRKDGQHFWVEITFKAVKANGEFKYYLANWVDLTERKRLRENMEFYILEVTRAQEEERKRIAHEIHDDSIQSLATVALNIDAIAKEKERLPEDIIQHLERLRANTNSILEGLRAFSHGLRPGVIDLVGLVPALEILTEELNKGGRVNTSLTIAGCERRLTPEAELVLFRIAQEALHNVRKHSGATKAVMKVKFTQRKVRLTVSDNGGGCELPDMLSDLATEGKLGLIGMQERARLLDGSFFANSQVGKGTTIVVEVGT